MLEPTERARRLKELQEQLERAREDVAAGRTYDLEALLAEWDAEDEALEHSVRADHDR